MGRPKVPNLLSRILIQIFWSKLEMRFPKEAPLTMSQKILETLSAMFQARK